MALKSEKPKNRNVVARGGRRRSGQRRRTSAADRRAVELVECVLLARGGLLADQSTTACRVFNGVGDGIDGLVIERLGDVLIAQLHEGRLKVDEWRVRELCEHARERLGARAVYRKLFARERSAALQELEKLHSDPTPWLGEAAAPEFPVVENGIRFLVRPYDGHSVGLFLEHRDNRQRVRERAVGCSVLNAFAYTCGFSVAAALGGARQTTSVDVSKKHLEWGKRNFAANRLDLGPHTFICGNIFDYYRRAQRQQRRFDLVILDPPTFARSRQSKRVFVLADDLERLVAGAVELINPGGHLLLATNHRRTSRRRLEGVARHAAGARSIDIVCRPELPSDFSGDRDYAKSILARVD